MPIFAKYSYLCNRFSGHSRRDGRVVDYNGLENRRAERHRGFESLSLRKKKRQVLLGVFLLRLRTGSHNINFIRVKQVVLLSKQACFIEQSMGF